MRQAADRKRSDREFEVRDKVFLKVKRFLQHFTSTLIFKLNPMYFGPYVIEAKVGKVAYKLRLSTGINVHLEFHVSLLKKSIEPGGHYQPAIEDELEETLEPRAILDRRVVDQGTVPLT